jgi:hypothetical protein
VLRFHRPFYSFLNFFAARRRSQQGSSLRQGACWQEQPAAAGAAGAAAGARVLGRSSGAAAGAAGAAAGSGGRSAFGGEEELPAAAQAPARQAQRSVLATCSFTMSCGVLPGLHPFQKNYTDFRAFLKAAVVAVTAGGAVPDLGEAQSMPWLSIPVNQRVPRNAHRAAAKCSPSASTKQSCTRRRRRGPGG